MHLRFLLLALITVGPVWAAPVDDAIALFNEKKYPDARAALEKIVAAEPQNARACQYLGLTLVRRSDPKAVDDALPWLEKAAKLAPNDADILTSYGMFSLVYAQKHISVPAANRGVDALEAALKIDPDNRDARVTLYEYYSMAPWPLSSKTKAAEHLAEMRKREPARAFLFDLRAKVNAKDYDTVFTMCDELLAREPASPVGLYEYGRAAAVTGKNLEKGLDRLHQFVALDPAVANRHKQADAWGRIGVIKEKQHDIPAARQAYQTMLEMEPGNKSPADALAKLKP